MFKFLHIEKNLLWYLTKNIFLSYNVNLKYCWEVINSVVRVLYGL